jgi:hypothetical protein
MEQGRAVMSSSDEIKQIAKTRQIVMPLIKQMATEIVAANDAKLERLLKAVEQLAKQQPVVNVTVPEIKLPKIEVPTPQVNYQPPDVHIDTTPVAKAVANLPLQKSDPTPIETPQYEPHDQAGGAIKYSGFLAQDGTWYIQRIAKNQQRYAKGRGDYSDAWEGRERLNYGYFNE